MLRTQDLMAFYGNICALKGISIEVRKREIVTIIGSNGAGKTTTLKAISGLIPKVKGRIFFEDIEITSFTPTRRVGLRISHVPEGRHVFPTLSVKDNLLLGAFLRFKSGLKKRIRIDYQGILDLFPALKSRQSQKAGTLSGGEQQMLTIGRALMSDPKLLLLDEPSMGLAPIVKMTIFQSLLELRARSLTLLLVEQDAEGALSIADRGYVLQTGSIVMQSTGDNLLRNEFVKEIYFGKKI